MEGEVGDQIEVEVWHAKTMSVHWTDTGKMILKHDLRDGGQINHVFDINPVQARQMKESKDA
jgi:hypothetical protein